MTDTIIGVELDPVPLIITKGRDFRWSFRHEDKDGKPVNFPAGNLFFEIQTGGAETASQTLEVDRANGGTWKLGATALAFDAKVAAVKAAVEALPAVGAGNAKVTASYTPQWIFSGSITGVTLSQNQVDGIDLAVNKVFDAVQGISGTDITFKFNNPGFLLTVTSKTSMDEATLLGWVVNTFNVNVQNAIKGVLGTVGVVSPVTEFYAPKRLYTIDFGGKLVHTPVAALAPDATGLTGQMPAVVPVVVAAGRSGITKWDFTIAASSATLKVESEDVDKVPNRSHWQLVWMPAGEPAGGDPVARGIVKIQS